MKSRQKIWIILDTEGIHVNSYSCHKYKSMHNRENKKARLKSSRAFFCFYLGL